MDSQNKLYIKVFSPYRVFFEGSADSLTAANAEGIFDVLYNHSNFFSMLASGKIGVNTGFEKVDIEIESGFIKVTDNQVVVFANV